MRRRTVTILATPVTLATLVLAAAATGQSLVVVDNPALGSFLDISGTGTPVFLEDDGEVVLDGSFAGSFVFPGGQIIVAQNGGLGFGQSVPSDLDPLNEPIPSDAAFAGQQATLMLWDDIDDKEGDVISMAMGDRVIVQWNWTDFDGAGSVVRFQAQIFHNSAPSGIYAQYLYDVVGSGDPGVSATIGYQDGAAGFGDVPVAFNRGGVIQPGTVLTLLIPEPCASDVDDNGRVGLGDLLEIILGWGCAGDCAADVDLDGVVGVGDLIEVINAWGKCPG